MKFINNKLARAYKRLKASRMHYNTSMLRCEGTPYFVWFNGYAY